MTVHLLAYIVCKQIIIAAMFVRETKLIIQKEVRTTEHLYYMYLIFWMKDC